MAAVPRRRNIQLLAKESRLSKVSCPLNFAKEVPFPGVYIRLTTGEGSVSLGSMILLAAHVPVSCTAACSTLETPDCNPGSPCAWLGPALCCSTKTHPKCGSYSSLMQQVTGVPLAPCEKIEHFVLKSLACIQAGTETWTGEDSEGSVSQWQLLALL